MSQPLRAWGRGAVANSATDASPRPPENHDALRPPGPSTSLPDLSGDPQPGRPGEAASPHSPRAGQVEPGAGHRARMPGAAEARRRGRASAEGRPRPGGGRKAAPSGKRRRPDLGAPRPPPRAGFIQRRGPARPRRAPHRAAAQERLPRPTSLRAAEPPRLRLPPPPSGPRRARSGSEMAREQDSGPSRRRCHHLPLPSQPPPQRCRLSRRGHRLPNRARSARWARRAGGRPQSKLIDALGAPRYLGRARRRERPQRCEPRRARAGSGGPDGPGRGRARVVPRGRRPTRTPDPGLALPIAPPQRSHAAARPAAPGARAAPPGADPSRCPRGPFAGPSADCNLPTRTSSFCFETGSLRVDGAGLLPGYHKQSWFVGSALASQDRSEDTSGDAR